MTARRRVRSWMDFAIELVDRFPGPAWAAYVVLVVVSIAITVVLRLLDAATLDTLTIVFAGLTFTPFAVMHYINGAAKRALDDFRPALGDLQPQFAEFERELTTTSLATGVVGAVIGIGVVTAGTLTVEGSWGVDPDNFLVTNVVTIVFQLILNTSLMTFLLHEIGHLLTITRIHRDATNIELWNVRPHNAFARVTVLAAIAITLPYVPAAILSALSTPNSMIAIVIVALALVLATLLFVGPLVGIRRRLVRERELQLSQTDRASEIAARRLTTMVDTGDPTGAAQLDSVMSALSVERDRLRKVSTWPWSAGTLRAFVTSLALPVLLWFLTTVLGRLLFG